MPAASKFSFESAVEEFFQDFPARRRDTAIFNLALGDGLKRDMTERLASLTRGFFPAHIIETLTRNPGPSVGRYYMDDEGEDYHEFDVGDYGPPAMTVMFAHGRAPADKSYAENVLKDYFLSKSTESAYWRQRDILSIPAEPAFTTDDYWFWHVFDHEAAHVLFGHEEAARPFGGRGGNFEECVSDVYSLLRHCQRFGTDTGFGRAMIMGRARLLPDMRGPYANTHMTVAALEAAQALDKDSLLNLSPRDTFALAVETVEKSALSRDLLQEFSAASVATMSMKPVEVVRYYAGSRLPPQLVGAFIDASLTMQNLPRLERVAIETARARHEKGHTLELT